MSDRRDATIRDQLGRQLTNLPPRPARIVSLCPSTTETVFALGAGDRLVGRTDYCCHPADRVEAVRSVGGTKKVRIDRVADLDPDLVLAVREENERAQVEELAARWPVVVFDPVDVPTAIDGVALLGTVLGLGEAGRRLADEIEQAFADLPRAEPRRVLYLIWRKPWMVAGAGTYIDDVLRRLGFVHAGAELDGRYPIVDERSARHLQPDLVLASSEPFPFTERHLDEIRRLAPTAEPLLVDGEAFSWHGARMLAAARGFRALLADLPANG